jgi:hypothetical protein
MTYSHKELRDMLPWYVNGTLEPGARQELEFQLEQSPQLRDELLWLRVLRSQMQEQKQAQVGSRSDNAGLDTLMALVHAEQSGKVSPIRKRFGEWVAATRRLPITAGFAAALVLSQAVIIGSLMDRPAPDAMEPLSGGTMAAGGQLLQITFKPQATEAQIRTLLSSVQADIVAGPGALGIYTVRVPDKQGEQALQHLRKDMAVVDSATLLQSR